MQYRVESIFYHSTLKCCITFSSLGHRCGYVGVNKTHPLFKVPYSELNLTPTVHGGLTYSSDNPKYPILQLKPLWWFGFDCAHLNDAKDWFTLKKSFPLVVWEVLWELEDPFPVYPPETVRTNSFVRHECCKLADQLIQF